MKYNDDDHPPPLHMDYQSRMKRLYYLLIQSGLVVSASYKPGTKDDIDCIHVRVAISSDDPPGVVEEKTQNSASILSLVPKPENKE